MAHAAVGPEPGLWLSNLCPCRALVHTAWGAGATRPPVSASALSTRHVGAGMGKPKSGSHGGAYEQRSKLILSGVPETGPKEMSHRAPLSCCRRLRSGKTGASVTHVVCQGLLTSAPSSCPRDTAQMLSPLRPRLAPSPRPQVSCPEAVPESEMGEQEVQGEALRMSPWAGEAGSGRELSFDTILTQATAHPAGAQSHPRPRGGAQTIRAPPASVRPTSASPDAGCPQKKAGTGAGPFSSVTASLQRVPLHLRQPGDAGLHSRAPGQHGPAPTTTFLPTFIWVPSSELPSPPP